MKGNETVLKALNDNLADELTAISQYMVHAGMCANWGYDKLHDAIEKRAIEEMGHAEKLIDRILYLEGTPIVSALNKMKIGAQVEAQIRNDYESEKGAVVGYNAAIAAAVAAGDNGSRALFESILQDEEAHIDWLEAQLDQISQMGIQNYLAQQLG